MKKFVIIYKDEMVISVDVNVSKLKKCNIGYSWNVNNC